RREARHVREQDGHLLALAFKGGPRVQDSVGEVFGRVRARVAYERVVLAYGNTLVVDKLLDGLLRVEQGPDHPLAIGGLAVESGERPEPLLTADQSGLAADLAAHGVGAHRLSPPLDLELAQLLEDEKPGTQLLRALTHDDLTRLGNAEEARRQVSRVTHRCVVRPQILANGADHDATRIDPHTHAELDPV